MIEETAEIRTALETKDTNMVFVNFGSFITLALMEVLQKDYTQVDELRIYQSEYNCEAEFWISIMSLQDGLNDLLSRIVLREHIKLI